MTRKPRAEDSTLEAALAWSLYVGGVLDSYPCVREFHPYWCCEHKIAVHLHRHLEFPQCMECTPGTAAHRYGKGRDWRIDFAWPERRLAVEVEGGIHSGGRHVRPGGFQGDVDKYNRLALDGWTLIRVTKADIESNSALDQIKRFLEGMGNADAG